MAPDDDAAIKLRAEDADDLAVISACLQDALVPVRDLAYDPEERTFLFVANRFRWEERFRAEATASCRRILCAVTLSDVSAVAYTGFRRSDHDRFLSLLAIRPEAGAVRLEFSGGAAIRLEVARIRCYLRDLGEPWPTRWQPRHDPDDWA
jgi:hypothetical protein